VDSLVKSHQELRVRTEAFQLAIEIFEVTSAFPAIERFALTDQIRRSSRSVSVNIVEAWHRRRYEGSFISYLTIACAEAGETQEWLAYGEACGYITSDICTRLTAQYEQLLRSIEGMIKWSGRWCNTQIPSKPVGRKSDQQ
jgi:four helix bundle protein